MGARLLLAVLLAGMLSACQGLIGPETDPWYMRVELTDADDTVKGIVSSPNAGSNMLVLDESSSQRTLSSQGAWLGFSFPFVPGATAIELSGSFEKNGGAAVLFSGEYAARLDVETSTGEHYDFSDDIAQENDVFGFFVIFSPSIAEGTAMVLTHARCTLEGSASLTLRWVDVVFQSNGNIDVKLYRNAAHLQVTCSRKRPAPL